MPYVKSDNPKRRRTPAKTREGFKGCCRCGKELPATEEYFQRNEHSDSGLQAYCRVCMGSRFRPPRSLFEVPKRRYKNSERVNDAIRKCLARQIAEMNALVFEEDRVKLFEDALCFRVAWESKGSLFKRHPGGQQIYYLENPNDPFAEAPGDTEEEIEA